MEQCDACKLFFDKLDRAHIKTRGSGAGWEEWEYILLCRYCHICQSHLNWKRFTDKYPHLIDVLKGKGWIIVKELGVYKIRRIMNG
jgi:hypothetical protein